MTEEALSLRRRRLDMALRHYPQGHPGGCLTFVLRLSCVCLASSLACWSARCYVVCVSRAARLTCVRVCDAACCAVFLCGCVNPCVSCVRV